MDESGGTVELDYSPSDSLSLNELRLCQVPSVKDVTDVQKFTNQCQLRRAVFDSPRVVPFNASVPEKYVGYADLPNQIFRYCAMSGFDFNLLVVGESGLGKSSFINNLFCSDIYVEAKYGEKSVIPQTTEIRSCTVTITENKIPVRLTLVDTPGFGDAIDNTDCWKKIEDYIDSKYEEYLTWENSSQRTRIKDMRVHCCLYFISPTGHRLRSLDTQLLLHLHKKCNVIPIIARADSLTHEDLVPYKKRILEDLKSFGIKTYEFPDVILRDMDERDAVENYINKFPFAIISSGQILEINGKTCRVRKYPWGVCEVDNPNHCDFISLRNLLLRTCTSHLIQTTDLVYYESYRARTLTSQKFGTASEGIDADQLIEAEKNKQSARIDQTREEFKKKLVDFENSLRNELSSRQATIRETLVREQENIDKMKKENNLDSLSVSDMSHKSSYSSTSDEPKKNKTKKKGFF